MTNYYMSNEERLIMSKCLSLNFKCYPVAVITGNNPKVYLEVEYNGKIIKSTEPDFEQKYIGYKINQVYIKFYEKIKNRL